MIPLFGFCFLNFIYSYRRLCFVKDQLIDLNSKMKIEKEGIFILSLSLLQYVGPGQMSSKWKVYKSFEWTLV